MQPLRKSALLVGLVPATLSCAVLLSFAPTNAAAAAGEAGAPPSDAGPKRSLPSLRPPVQGVQEIRIDKTPPDPDPAMREEMQWVFDLRYERGDIFFVGVHPLDLGVPQTTPRVMGRFALELFEGPTLIERVRFDFPMLGTGDAQNKNFLAPVSFEKKITTRIGVMFPQTKKGTRLDLWDRATNLRYRLPWPPDAIAPSTTAPSTTASAPDAGSAPGCDGGCARTE